MGAVVVGGVAGSNAGKSITAVPDIKVEPTVPNRNSAGSDNEIGGVTTAVVGTFAGAQTADAGRATHAKVPHAITGLLAFASINREVKTMTNPVNPDACLSERGLPLVNATYLLKPSAHLFHGAAATGTNLAEL
jgi:hypothetical protein